MSADASPAMQGPEKERMPVSPAAGCALSVVAGLACAAVFSFVLWFNQQGQIVYAPQPYRETRLWLLRGVEGRGLGVSTTRPIAGATGDRVCAVTSVAFYFVGGAAPEADTVYCECFARSGSGWAAAGACPE